jgi:hypothetical protein
LKDEKESDKQVQTSTLESCRLFAIAAFVNGIWAFKSRGDMNFQKACRDVTTCAGVQLCCCLLRCTKSSFVKNEVVSEPLIYKQEKLPSTSLADHFILKKFTRVKKWDLSICNQILEDLYHVNKVAVTIYPLEQHGVTHYNMASIQCVLLKISEYKDKLEHTSHAQLALHHLAEAIKHADYPRALDTFNVDELVHVP